MAGEYEIMFSISKKAMKLIRAGKAVLESGGVRSLTGQMIEMAKPIATTAAKTATQAAAGGMGLGPVGAAVNITSSLANNVQSDILQRSVNMANAKLDTVVKQLGTLANAMQGLQQVQVLSWVNSAFSLANCGISVAGFYMTLNKLGQVQGSLGQFFDLYKQNSEIKHVEDYQNYLMQLKNHLSFLQERYKNDTFDRQSFLQRETTIENDLTRTENYLRKILKAFQARTIDGKVGCQIIFTLCVVYAQTVNEFCCQYFYAHGIQHPMFRDWISVLDEIDSPAFREFLKRYFSFDREYIAVSPKLKQAAHHILFESVGQQKSRLMLCADTVKQLPEEQYVHLDDLLNQEVFSGLSIEIPELKGIDIDKVLTQRLESEECWITDEDTVLIPLTI